MIKIINAKFDAHPKCSSLLLFFHVVFLLLLYLDFFPDSGEQGV